jgi:hypothetical protein
MSNVTKRVMTEVVFAAGCKPRPDEAVRELKESGHEVRWLPEEVRERSLDPSDDFIETVITTSADPDEVQYEVGAIVGKYGGDVVTWGALAPGEEWVPFWVQERRERQDQTEKWRGRQ